MAVVLIMAGVPTFIALIAINAVTQYTFKRMRRKDTA